MPASVQEFEAAVLGTIRTYDMLGEAPGDTVLAAVSGGADSVALLLALVRLGIPTAVAHFDHGWRGDESRKDRDFVRDLATRLDTPFHEGRWEGGTPRRDEAGARAERHRFLRETAKTGGYARIALAHTRGDRTETFLLNLVRGAGADGLSSMKPVTGTRIRPLIETARPEIEHFLGQIGQDWREDSTNLDLGFARNRLRHEVIPKLRALNPRLDETISRTMEIMGTENEWMHAVSGEWLAQNIRNDGEEVVLFVGDLPGKSPAMIRRVLREAIVHAHRQIPGGTGAIGAIGEMNGADPDHPPLLDGIGLEHIDAVGGLLGPGRSGRTIELPGPVHVERSFGTLRFFRAGSEPATYDRELSIPGRIEIPEIGQSFEARIPAMSDPISLKPNPDRVFVDGERLGPCVRIRNWHKGDLYNPDGPEASTLKALFQEKRVPWRRRLEWPVVIARSSIVWVASFPVSRDFAPSARSRKTVELVVAPIIHGAAKAPA